MKKLIIILSILFLSFVCDVIDDVTEDAEKQIKIWISEIADYGNFCGPWNELKNTNPEPADDLDSCCMEHDLRWQDVQEDEDFLVCGEGDRAELDAELVECVKVLNEDTSQWENPPADEEEALDYIDLIIFIFEPCMAE